MIRNILKYSLSAFAVSYGLYYGYNNLFYKKFYKQAYEISTLKNKIQKKYLKAEKSIIIHLTVIKSITIPSEKFAKQKIALELRNISPSIENKLNYHLQLTGILVQNLAKKELKTNQKTKETVNPFLPPFLDGIFITELSQTHRLIFNRFAIADLHVLVITKNFEKQTHMMNQNDIESVVKVMQALDGFCFFNSGSQSGASQPHKHFQIMPFKEIKKSQIIKKITSQATRTKEKKNFIFQFEGFNFLHCIIAFTLKEPLEQQILTAYEKCYQFCFNELDLKFQTSYNLIITQEWLMLIPRKRSHILLNTNFPISLNAMSFTGSIAVKNEQQLQQLSEIYPEQLFSEITFKDEKEFQQYMEGIKMFQK